ncbi:hypothetical protein CLI92_09065 [Vandammella animalimorsus]|uniref:Uncharacterized protein n=1 Tax=Vandammella animalimorsus TaxID=2029117 RepID=A0A2A2T4Q7_9BURK|nr:hypothetical protein [Vandammella animalimorsus]PAT31880.1 hypothetical protein CK626_07740 [Vandammella animalimorsus]PAX16473.1 hypothetical protein CLI92_09065 [Vandammella animalimorsus]PAX18888.1 hypothetical protein CLI93_11145 [Vandammella animalimorsus]
MLHHFFAADGAPLPWLATAVVNHSSQEQTLSLDLDLPEFSTDIGAMLLRLGTYGTHYLALSVGAGRNHSWADMTGNALEVRHLWYDKYARTLKIPPGLVAQGQQSLLLVVTRGVYHVSSYFGRLHYSSEPNPYYLVLRTAGSPDRRTSNSVAQGTWYANAGSPALLAGVHPAGGFQAARYQGSILDFYGITLPSQGDGIWTGTYTGNSQANRNIGCPFKPRLMIFTDRTSNQAYLCPMYRGRIFSVVQHLHIPEENYVNEDGVLLRTSYLNISGRNYTVTAYRGE